MVNTIQAQLQDPPGPGNLGGQPGPASPLVQTRLTADFLIAETPIGALLIDRRDQTLYFNGRMIRFISRPYNPRFIKDKQRPPKEKIYEITIKGLVFQINRGPDGRLFFHLFKLGHYDKYRAPMLWSGSLFRNKWYEGDLSQFAMVLNPTPAEAPLCT